MRICYLNNDLRDTTGSGRFCLSLLKAVRKALPETEVFVLISEQGSDLRSALWPGENTNLSGYMNMKALINSNKIKLFLNLLRIRRILRQCDIIHALDGWPYGVIAAVASLNFGKKFIITAIGTGAVKPLYQPIKSWLLKWAYKRADKVIAASKNTKREILKIMPDLKIEVINHGVDFDKFSPEGRQIPISNLKPYILSVGTDKPRKGFEYSIRAFAEIRKEFPSLKYVIVSDIRRKEIKDLIKNLNLEDSVVILKNLEEEDLTSVYKNAELFILLPCDDNKDMEGFGLVFLEAAASGLPVVGTKDTGAEGAILDGENGFTVLQKDSLLAAEAVKKILKNQDLRKTFSENSIKFAKSMSWVKVAEKYSKVYEEI